MSEFDTYDDDDTTEQEPGRNPLRAQLKRLEKENNELRKQTAQFAETQKKMAFMEAGIPLDSPMTKYFIKGYDGELTPEAIRVAAEEAQLIAPPTPQNEADRQGWRETNRIASGAEISPEPAGWAKRIRDASTEAELMEIFQEAAAAGVDLSGE